MATAAMRSDGYCRGMQRRTSEGRVSLTQQLADAKALLDSTNAALAKAPRGKGSRADLELIRNDLTAVQTALGEAEADFNGGRYMVARTKLENVAQRARAIMDEIANAGKPKQ